MLWLAFLFFLVSMLSEWVSFLAYPNLFGIKGFAVVVVVSKHMILNNTKIRLSVLKCILSLFCYVRLQIVLLGRYFVEC
jgi:hypothetical protein